MKDSLNIEHVRLIEAALFVSGRWMDIEDLARLAGTASTAAVKGILDDLRNHFNSSQTALTILEQNGRYKMDIKEDLREKVYYLAPEPELSQALIKVLALIAKNQPVKQSIVVDTIGNRTYDYIRELRKKGFIDTRKKGRTKVLTTTSRFRKYFGLRDGQLEPEEGLSKWVQDQEQEGQNQEPQEGGQGND